MTLTDAITAAGMTPPPRIVPGRWLRFPGAGKGKSNRAGWCRQITPTLALYGDWSSNFSATWRDDAHRDDEVSRRLLEEARQREREFAIRQREQQANAAFAAAQLIRIALYKSHCYLERKGFPERLGLVHDKKLLIPMRDALDYSRVISVQSIAEDGEKRFLTGSRTRNAIYRIGVEPARARRIVLCEGYATGLSLDAALQRLPGPHTVIVCFSARNLEVVAENFPRAMVAADNDESRTGEMAARNTGLVWVMPPETGTDFNDLHRAHGLHIVTEVLRSP